MSAVDRIRYRRKPNLRRLLLGETSWKLRSGACFNALCVSALRLARVTFSASACYGMYRAGIVDKETAERWAGGVTFVDAPRLIV